MLDDASATTEQRLAAAIALGAQPSARARIRVAAETSVSPKLRVALDTVAEGAPDDALIEAAIEDGAESSRARAQA